MDEWIHCPPFSTLPSRSHSLSLPPLAEVAVRAVGSIASCSGAIRHHADACSDAKTVLSWLGPQPAPHPRPMTICDWNLGHTSSPAPSSSDLLWLPGRARNIVSSESVFLLGPSMSPYVCVSVILPFLGNSAGHPNFGL